MAELKLGIAIENKREYDIPLIYTGPNCLKTVR